MEPYKKSIWLNKDDSPSIGSVVAFDGDVKYSNGDERTIFLAIGDCGRVVKIIKNTESIDNYIDKLKELKKVVDDFLNHLYNSYITLERVEKIFSKDVNGNLTRGNLEIFKVDDKYFIRNITKDGTGKYITTVKELADYLIINKVPFDFINDR